MNPVGPFAIPHALSIASYSFLSTDFFFSQFPNLPKLFSPESQSRIPSFPGGPRKRNQPFTHQRFPSLQKNVLRHTV